MVSDFLTGDFMTCYSVSFFVFLFFFCFENERIFFSLGIYLEFEKDKKVKMESVQIDKVTAEPQ